MSRPRNVAKLMARLNPRSMPLEPTVGRSTRGPELTAIDIAGALGAAAAGDHRKRLAVDVLCLRWWPARVEGPPRTVGYRTVHTDPARHRADRGDGKPVDPGQKQFLDGCCHRLPIEQPAETPAMLAIIALLERRLRLRVERAVPEDVRPKVLAADFLARWARAVIDEYRRPHHCQNCKAYGRPGEIPVPVEEGGKIVRFEWKLCEACDGAGVMPWGKHRRAKALRIREGTFRDAELNEVHDGALALLRELEHRGAVLLVRRLGR